jgi:1-acyl-sn-glycerol-3-phosphate acyltransferase
MRGEPLTRFFLRALLLPFRSYFLEFKGLEHIAPDKDPFILAPSHNHRVEAVLFPAALFLLRDGKAVHFLSDWNFRLVPGLAFLLRRAQTIPLTNKSARPRFLNVFKPWFESSQSGFDQVKMKINEGSSVGLYPEGKLNRNPSQLMPGRLGAAKLSLETGGAVVPVGFQFPQHVSNAPLGDFEPMVVEFGPPLKPPSVIANPTTDQIKDWHASIMTEIARLSKKTWPGQARKKDS